MKEPTLRVVSSKPTFEYREYDDDTPEMPLAVVSPAPVKSVDAPVAGVDLTGRPKIIVLAGRGRSGKTLAARWLVDRAWDQGRKLIMADLDPTNPTLKLWFPDAGRPARIDDVQASIKWLEGTIGLALEGQQTAVFDMGGGDTTLRRLVDTMPRLLDVVEEAGSSLVLLHFLGPQEDDLSPLVALESRGFQPAATGLVLNEGVTEIGSDPTQAFARIRKHSAYRAAVARGAVPLRMPRLQNATAIETRRIHFSEATKTLGPFDRARVKAWLDEMDGAWSGIHSWLP